LTQFKEGDRVVYTGRTRYARKTLVGKAGAVLAAHPVTAEVLFDFDGDDTLYLNVLNDNLAREKTPHVFYAGQLVRCLEDNDPGIEFTAGDIYEVERFDGGAWPRVSVVEDDSGDPNGWGAQFFEPFEPEPTAPAPPAREAIVCVLAEGTGQPLPAIRPYVHANRASAISESERLAITNPGKNFAVYEAVSVAYAPPPPKPVAMSFAL
jgi:hypothetical protein